MIKKITLASVATMALLFIPAQAEGNKCGAGMGQKANSCPQGKCNTKGMKRGGLLVNLPSPMRFIMKHESDAKFALTDAQKKTFEAQRNKMMPKMKKLKDEIRALSQEIKAACKKGETAAEQKERVEKLATLKTEATMMKLTCIEKVKATLTKEQKAYISAARAERMGKMKNKMQGMKKKNAKCQSAKCGSK